MAGEIGTYMERSLHAALKQYFEPDTALHEVRYKGYIADILNRDGVTEIQTRAFDRLRKKLPAFLEDTHVTLVYPAVRQKWLIWVDPETGEATNKRRSPKTGTPYGIFPELYKIKPLLLHENLRLCIIMVDLEEYRSLTGWSADRKRGSTRIERMPVGFGETLVMDTVADYRQLVPETLVEPFTTADYALAAKLSPKAAQCAVNVLRHTGTIERCDKRGNAYLYRRIAPVVTGSTGK